jgi:methyl-accepting chemotaxis protein
VGGLQRLADRVRVRHRPGVDGATADTAEARAAFLASAAAFRQELQALRGARITAAETELIDRITQHFDEFSALDRTIVEAYRSGAATQVALANQLVAVDEIKIFNAIADGDGDLTQRIHDDGRDEIAEAAGGFNRFADRMQELVAAVAGQRAA